MGLADLPFVVQTHYQYFPDSFFARLGPRFMARYYRTFLDGPQAVAIVIERDGIISGYLVGILATSRHRKLLMEYHGLGLGLVATLAMATRPHMAAKFIGTRLVRYVRALRKARATEPSDAPVTPRSAVLSHVAVTQSSRCQGLGTLLVEEFTKQAKAAGCARACLVTAPGAQGASTFYQRRSWSQVQQQSATDGKELLHFELQLAPAPQTTKHESR